MVHRDRDPGRDQGNGEEVMNPALWWMSIVMASAVLGWLSGWAHEIYQKRQWRREINDWCDDDGS